MHVCVGIACSWHSDAPMSDYGGLTILSYGCSLHNPLWFVSPVRAMLNEYVIMVATSYNMLYSLKSTTGKSD